MVTHELDIARFANRIVSYLDGRIVDDAPVLREAAALSS